MTGEPCDYSVVVPAYNEAPMLRERLPPLVEIVGSTDDHRGEIIVVDNNSSDETAEVASALGARVVFEPVNQIAGARNCGAEAAHGRYLIFVDADTSVSQELIAGALAELASGNSCGGGALVGTTEPVSAGVQRAFKRWNHLAKRRHWAAGSFVYALKEGWQAVGGFSAKVYAAEEIFFSRALRRWGRKRGQEFTILDFPVDTSMRKFEWYAEHKIWWHMLRLVLCPWLVRFRWFCRLWYDRPADG